MKALLHFTRLVVILVFCVIPANAQDNLTDEQVLELYKGLRVADVCDGMDMVGLRDAGTMDPSIEPLWRDVDNFGHRFTGIAVTARYVPTNKVVKSPMEKSEFQKWEGEWYTKISDEPFVPFLKEGSVVVLDVQGDGDVGSVGSFNALAWVGKGARGIVSNGGIRDIDEVIKEKIPVYLDYMERGRGIRPGRNEIESFNKPITVGGVLVRPGDVIVADGDGVIVVPREYAKPVAEFALEIMNKDKAGRKGLYEQLNIPLDETVK
ncbi:MAG TPA: RraA family protein [Bacteroidales bacterium]|jgi:regulator of RNase E activity RraA|nr:RraA family protein [Bacteroidales bacterium]